MEAAFFTIKEWRKLLLSVSNISLNASLTKYYSEKSKRMLPKKNSAANRSLQLSS